MTCSCGFKFAGPGEFRNCDAFIMDGKGGVICPKCGKWWLDGKEVKIQNDKSE
jgi:hypothetical protein